MKKLMIVAAVLLCCGTARSQMLTQDVDNLEIQNLEGTKLRLTWNAEPNMPCIYAITYSVFKSKRPEFEPTEQNRVAQGLKTTSITLDDPSNSYFHVRAVMNPVNCPVPPPPPGFRGTITIHPISDSTEGLATSLRTKWRLSSKGGTLSFMINGVHLGASNDAEYLDKVQRCSFSLILLDAQGFKIREIGFKFLSSVGSNGRAEALDANEMATLSTQEYQDFQRGDWNLGWSCY